MNKQLVSSNNPILHNPTELVNLDNERDLIKELSIIMGKEQGIGIAAPQIGESKNLFLVLNLEKEEVKVFAFREFV